jgi:hypothetical protein
MIDIHKDLYAHLAISADRFRDMKSEDSNNNKELIAELNKDILTIENIYAILKSKNENPELVSRIGSKIETIKKIIAQKSS